PEAQRALLARAVTAGDVGRRMDAMLAAAGELAGQARAARDLAWLDLRRRLGEDAVAVVRARHAVLAALELFQEATGQPQVEALPTFCALLGERRLDLDDAVYRAVGSASPRTLQRWARRLREHGLAGL